ncbi:DESIGUAL/Modifying wall lignin-1/2 - like 6 [Theobroma cacao]|nr:DESIGUAL/Modifying wall lignin-1/2 - like 6 [Theobroma cacao]
MERKAIVLCNVVGFLGILSAVTGFAAEATRIQASQVKFISPTQCQYPRSPALGLGLTAAVALLIAQIIINSATGCICCKRTRQTWNSNWTKALVFYVVSCCLGEGSYVENERLLSCQSAWRKNFELEGFTFVIAFLLLLTGSALNDQHGEESVYFGNYYCYVVKPGVFAGGAVLALASVTLGIFYYLTVNMAKDSTGPWGNAPVPNQGGIAMGQPQFPPQSSQDPVFVHEDTYIRRQFT